MLDDILESARENGFDFLKDNPDNLAILAGTLEPYIDSLGAVMPKSRKGNNIEEQRVFFKYVNLLAGRAPEYGLNALEVREALAREFDFPAIEVRVKGAGVTSHVFYRDDSRLSGYLKRYFTRPKTFHEFEMK